MKKIYLILLASMLVFTAFAQYRDYNYVASKNTMSTVSINPNAVYEKGAKAMILDEGFETAVPPVGWLTESPDGGSGWNQQAVGTTPIPGWTGGTITAPAEGGSKIAYCTWDTGGAASNDQWLITPQLSIVSGDNLSFFIINFYEEYLDVIEIKVSTTTADIASFTETLGTVAYDGTGSGAGSWTEVVYDLSAYDGQDIYIGFREVVADNYNDGGSIGLDNVKIGTPAALDGGLTGISLPPIFAVGLMDIGGVLQNYGTNNIISFDLTYTIDAGPASAIYSVTGVDIAYGETYNFTHDVQFDFSAAADYVVEITLSNVNGGIDENSENDVISKDVTAAFGVVQRRVLHEVLTSSSCAPCASANPVIDAVAFAPANSDISAVIKYQVSWPGDGDPYQTPMAADRVTYYGTSGVPDFWVDAHNESGVSYTQAKLDTYAGIPSFFEIDGTHTVIGNQVEVEVTITPNEDFEGVCHVVVIEKETTENVSSNGETEFHNVAMAMLPTTSGTTVSLTSGTPHTFTVSYDMSTTFVEETFDLDVVMFLQIPATKEVMQSNYSVLNNIGNDLILTGIEAVSDITDCAYSATSQIKAIVHNFGETEITTFDISYSIDGGALVEETVTEAIAAGADYEYIFTQTADLSELGIHEIEISFVYADDISDVNNSDVVSVISGDEVITVNITFDDYPSETSWEIIDLTYDIVIASGSNYIGGSLSEEVCVLTGACYEFVIYDAAGDGLCCDYGVGDYAIYRGGVEVGSGGSFGSSETVSISIQNDIELADITICEGEEVVYPVAGIGTFDIAAASIDNATAGTTEVAYIIAESTDCEVSYTFNVIVLSDVIDITADDITVCQGSAISFPVGSGAYLPASVDNSVIATTAVVYTINEGLACEATTTFDVIVNEMPEAAISLDGFVLSTTATTGIQWYFEATLIDGATEQTYTCTADGDYYVVVTLADCSNQSNTINVVGTSIADNINDSFNVYPNPANSKIYVECEYQNITLIITDITGKRIIGFNDFSSEFIDVSNFSSGVYFIEVRNDKNEGGIQKLIIE